jgi:hypothetical protein
MVKLTNKLKKIWKEVVLPNPDTILAFAIEGLRKTAKKKPQSG